MHAGRRIRLAPKPPITPINSISMGKFGLKMDRQNAAENIMLPDMTTLIQKDLQILFLMEMKL